jgi:hypothetical protein
MMGVCSFSFGQVTSYPGLRFPLPSSVSHDKGQFDALK